MPILYAKDIINGTSIEEDRDGTDITRVFLVTQVDGNAGVKSYRALTTDGIPKIGDVHPAVKTAVCIGRSAQPVSGNTPDQFHVTCRYTNRDDNISWRVGTTTSSTETDFDVDGKIIFVEHDLLLDGSPSGPKQHDEQFPTVEVQVPSTVIQFSGYEDVDPVEMSKLYAGKVNKKEMFGYPAGAWLCTRIDAGANRVGGKWNTTYEFQLGQVYVDPLGNKKEKQKEKRTWDSTVVYVFPQGYEEPDEKPWQEKDKGIKKVKVYKEADFTQIPMYKRALEQKNKIGKPAP